MREASDDRGGGLLSLVSAGNSSFRVGGQIQSVDEISDTGRVGKLPDRGQRENPSVEPSVAIVVSRVVSFGPGCTLILFVEIVPYVSTVPWILKQSAPSLRPYRTETRIKDQP